MGEKFCRQEKAAGPTPLRSPGPSHQGRSLLSLPLALYHAPDQLTPLFWEEQTLSTVTLMMPNAAYEPSLTSPHDKPFMVFICLLYICHSDLIEDTQATMRYGPRSNSPVVSCT